MMHWGQWFLFGMGLAYGVAAIGYSVARDWRMAVVLLLYGLANMVLAGR